MSAGSSRFEILRRTDSGSEGWLVYIDTAVSFFFDQGRANFKHNTWMHVAFSWKRELGATVSSVTLKMHEQGASIGSVGGLVPGHDWVDLQFCALGSGDDHAVDVGFFDIRLDDNALSDDEILRIYNLVADPDARPSFVETAGRYFDIEANMGRAEFQGVPGRRIASLRLVEGDYHDGSLLRDR